MLVFLFFGGVVKAGPVDGAGKAATAGVVVDVSLNPSAGDFKAKTDEVSGTATVDGDTVSAEKIIVKLANIKTGMPMRDTHTKKYLETSKYPEAILLKATGKGGKGTGRIKIRGIEKDIAGTYKIDGDMMLAEFPLKLSEFGISGIKYMGVGVEDDIKLHVNIPVKKGRMPAAKN
ncbi:MAG: YceI family protein [Bdellovibrio sp.]|nr:MAG: YceI family protein [Bdellovibrio sp.]